MVLAHSILYTYVAPLLGPAGLSGQTDRVLLTFGVASLAGVWTSGMLIDRRLRALVLLSLVGFALAVLALGLAGTHAPAVYVAVAAWGVAFGGSPTLLNGPAEAAGPGADVAQSILATVWNVAIAGGGIVGGLLLDACGAGSCPGPRWCWRSPRCCWPARRALMAFRRSRATPGVSEDGLRPATTGGRHGGRPPCRAQGLIDVPQARGLPSQTEKPCTRLPVAQASAPL